MGDSFSFRSEIDTLAGKSRFRSSPVVPLRKTLADVTNIQQCPKRSIAEPKSMLVTGVAKDMNRLIKENEALMKENLALKMQLAEPKENEVLMKENLALKKQLSELNKITELSATELHKLRLNLQSSYQQNLQLAQAHSQMLAELNSSKDRLKSLHHELGCMRGVLNMKTLALQDKEEDVDCQQPCNKAPSQAANPNIKGNSISIRRISKDTGQTAAIDTAEKNKSQNRRLHVRRKSVTPKSVEPACTDDLLKLDDVKAAECTDNPVMLDDVKAAAQATTDNKENSKNKRLHVQRKSVTLKSVEPARTDDLLKLDDAKAAAQATTDNKEKSENKRLCVRRQSSRFKSEGPKSTEDLFELDDIELPMHSEGDETSGGGCSLVEVERNSFGSISTEERRMSLGRPSRRAAVKVQSYKEIPLNLKMRRNE